MCLDMGPKLPRLSRREAVGANGRSWMAEVFPTPQVYVYTPLECAAACGVSPSPVVGCWRWQLLGVVALAGLDSCPNIPEVIPILQKLLAALSLNMKVAVGRS